MASPPSDRPYPPEPPPVTRIYDADRPAWTTGQGIGFLVALPGYLSIFLSLLLLVAADSLSESGTTYDLLGAGLTAFGAVGIIGGLLAAIPGSIVFYKCKRRN